MARKVLNEAICALLIVSIFFITACPQTSDIEDSKHIFPEPELPFIPTIPIPTYTVEVIPNHTGKAGSAGGVIVEIFAPYSGEIIRYIELLPAASTPMFWANAKNNANHGWRLPDSTEMSYIYHWYRENKISREQITKDPYLLLWTSTEYSNTHMIIVDWDMLDSWGILNRRGGVAGVAYVRDYTP